MKKVLLFLLLAAPVAPCIFAQNTALAQFYRQNWQLVNPAAVDRLFMFSPRYVYPSQVMLACRTQQTGTSTAPLTGFLAWEGKYVDNFQPGGQFFFDHIGAFSTLRLAGSFKFVVPGDGGARGYFWSIGIQPGLVRLSVDRSKLSTEMPDDPLIDFYGKPVSSVDCGLGAFLRHTADVSGALWYAGVSTPAAFSFLKKKSGKTGFDAASQRQLNVIAGRIMDLSGGMLELSSWLRAGRNTEFTTVGLLPFSLDGNARWYFNLPGGGDVYDAGQKGDRAGSSRGKVFWGGAGLATNGLLSFEFGHIVETSAANEFAQKWRLGCSTSLPIWGRGGIGAEVTATCGLRRQ